MIQAGDTMADGWEAQCTATTATGLLGETRRRTSWLVVCYFPSKIALGKRKRGGAAVRSNTLLKDSGDQPYPIFSWGKQLAVCFTGQLLSYNLPLPLRDEGGRSSFPQDRRQDGGGW